MRYPTYTSAAFGRYLVQLLYWFLCKRLPRDEGFERKGRLNRHTRYRPATTTRNTDWRCGRVARCFEKGSVESTHKVPTHCFAKRSAHNESSVLHSGAWSAACCTFVAMFRESGATLRNCVLTVVHTTVSSRPLCAPPRAPPPPLRHFRAQRTAFAHGIDRVRSGAFLHGARGHSCISVTRHPQSLS